jgi:hypothetical protein
LRQPRRRERFERFDTVRADDDHFARLDIAHIRCAYEVQRARLGAHDHGIAEATQRERPEPVRIAHCNKPIFRHQCE